MIDYVDDPSGLSTDQLGGGFFEGCRRLRAANDISPTSAARRSRSSRSSRSIRRTGSIVGFVSALGDGVLTAFVPLLEVLPAYRGRGIGRELMRRVLGRLADRYSIDLVCDPELVPFYERIGGTAGTAIQWRNRDTLVAEQRVNTPG